MVVVSLLKEVQTGSCKPADLEGGVEEEEDLGVGKVLSGSIEMWFPSLPLALLLLAGVSRGTQGRLIPKLLTGTGPGLPLCTGARIFDCKSY